MEQKLVLKDEVFEVVVCVMEVLNLLRHGLLEKPDENALVVEFGLRNIPFRQQPSFDVMYKRVLVGKLIVSISLPYNKGYCCACREGDMEAENENHWTPFMHQMVYIELH
jgi:hypothetical protein